jgi:bacillithiol system protein YtxJ|tara:strand:- start:8 stop:379 length:372 start_codon:yes stop_codon:yes gene_type:complete
MGLFTKDKGERINWKTLELENQLTEFIELSKSKPIAMFKHSTRCSLSSVVKSRLERAWNINDNDIDMYYLDLLNYRNISNKIVSLFAIEHQSPQLIVLHQGKVLYHASHGEIDAGVLKESIEK